MTVLTINLQHGLSSSGSPTSATELAEAVEGIDADVVAMQEVDRGQRRSGSLDQAQVIADALAMSYLRTATTVAGDIAGKRRPPSALGELAGQYQGAGYGIAIASRWPVLAWFVRPLPAMPTRYPVRRSGRCRLRSDEPRALLAVLLDTPRGQLSVGCTHLSLLPALALWQARIALTAMSTLACPVVLAGDFNLGPGALGLLAPGWQRPHALTFPAARPDRQIDHVLVHGARVNGARAWRLPISDHRALAVDLEYPLPEG
ncbi:MAG: endonuclease/exonuclease/phosphatase family protein [Beutenbergiaceae bacterium]